MSSFLSINKKQVPFMITLTIVSVLLISYFSMYVPSNEKNMQAQRYRVLQNIDTNLQSKIINSAALLNQLLEAKIKDAGSADRNALETYIDSFPRKNFTLSPFRIIEPISKKSLKDTLRANVDEEGPTIRMDRNGEQFTLSLSKKTTILTRTINGRLKAPDSIAGYAIDMKSDLKRFLVPLLPARVFDQYIIFKNKKVVWEDFSSGISLSDKDTLLKTNYGRSASAVADITISGKAYKVFMQRMNFGNADNLVVVGLLSASTYRDEITKLPLDLMLLLSTIAIIIIVAFPWLKLFQMGNKDMLKLSDGIACLAVAILLCSLLFFVSFKYNLNFRPGEVDEKRQLANGISNAVDQEIRSAYECLSSLDSLIKKNEHLQTDLRQINTDSIEGGDLYKINTPKLRIDSITVSTLKKITQGRNIHQVFWLDAKGGEQYNWTSGNQNTPKGDFAERNYFSKIIDSTAYHLDGDINKIFYLDQVVSWTRGEFTSILSVPSIISDPTKRAVAAMSFDIKSIQKPVLTPGYTFAIINTDGGVMYHTDSTKNLNENLIHEFSKKAYLKSALKASTDTSFTTDYFGKAYTVRVQPMKYLPYFIVIFSDNAYLQSRDMEVYSFTLSMMLCFFSFLAIQLILLILTSSKKSMVRGQQFETIWIAPKISCQRQYDQSVVFNLALLVLLAIFYTASTFLQFFFILLFAVSMTGLFLNAIFTAKYKAANKEDYKFKRSACITVSAIIIITNIFAIEILSWESYVIPLVFQLTTINIALFIHFSRNWLQQKLQQLRTRFPALKLSFTGSFAFMALTRLIITSGIPIMFFYIEGYNYEQNLNIRYRQVQFAEELLEKYPTIKGNKIKEQQNSKNDDSGIFHDQVWINSISYQQDAIANYKYTKEEEISLKLFRLFRFNKSAITIAADNFYYKKSIDSKIFFNHFLKDMDSETGTKTYKKLPNDNGYLVLTSAPFDYRMPSLWKNYGGVFWLLLLTGIYLLYKALHSIIKKIFAQNVPSTIGWEMIDRVLLNKHTLNNLLFMIGLPGSGKIESVLKAIENNEIQCKANEKLVYDKIGGSDVNVFEADLIMVPDLNNDKTEQDAWNVMQQKAIDKRYKLIIVNHFEYNLKDAVTNNLKLNFLEKLMLNTDAKIIVLSAVHPVSFLDSLNNSQIDISQNAQRHDLERWHVLLGHFRILIKPLFTEQKVTDKKEIASDVTIKEVIAQEETVKSVTPEQKDEKTLWEKVIIEETTYTHFLHKMQQPVIEAVRSTDPDHLDVNSLAFKLHATSHYFYMYIWQSLTREEKFILYDLAEEGLVNSFDDYNLSMLISKGLIINTDGRLKLMNRGFRNFILTSIGTSEAMKIRNEISDNGNWSTMKGPLQLVIIVILVFLIVSQEGTYSKILSYVATLGAGIPIVLKLFTLFDKNDVPKS